MAAPNYAERLGARLRTRRLLAGMSGGDAAKAAGFHLNTIYGWETGKSVPRADNLQVLQQLYRERRITDRAKHRKAVKA